jgi:sec-independent protein translocase protein TatA
MTTLLLFLPEPGMSWLLVILVIVIILFGSSKLPELAKAIGKSKKAFKDGLDEADEDKKEGRSKLESVDDEALFEEARRRAQQMRADETKKIEH